MSFGFKHGLPEAFNFCFDLRFIKNPYYIEELRQLSGLDPSVREFVLSAPNVQLFLQKTLDLLGFVISSYSTDLTIVMGCTGGRHRSVALVAEVARFLEKSGYLVQVLHRDLQR